MYFRYTFQRVKEQVIRGYYEVPHLYLALVLMTGGATETVYRYINSPTYDEVCRRHKNRYLVLRPEDPRVAIYPEKFITDVDLLKKYQEKN